MRLDEAIMQYVVEQTETDDSHTWFITANAEEADRLVDTRYVEYGGWSFLVGYHPENRRIAMAYDHKFWDDYDRYIQDEINLHHKYPRLDKGLLLEEKQNLKFNNNLMKMQNKFLKRINIKISRKDIPNLDPSGRI